MLLSVGVVLLLLDALGSTYHPPKLDGDISRRLPVGQHSVSVKLRLHIFDSADVPRAGQYARGNPDESKELATIDLPLSDQFDVCDDANAPTLTFVDERQRQAVESAVKVTSVQVHRGGLLLKGSVEEPPVRVDFRVLVRPVGASDPVEARDLVSAGPHLGAFFSATAAMPVAAGERVDVIFRPSLQAARNRVDMAKIWGDDVVIRGVTVTPDPSATTSAPATRP
jgi:hypothetical protein